jgi:hypothetical protein
MEFNRIELSLNEELEKIEKEMLDIFNLSEKYELFEYLKLNDKSKNVCGRKLISGKIK